MSVRRNLHLMTSSLAVAGMIAAPVRGIAQPAGGPGADQPAYTQAQADDPPARVGRLALFEGTVSFHAGGETSWSPAVLNGPVSDGYAFWTEPRGLAKIEVTASTVWMNESTELDLTTLNDMALHAAEPQGEVYMHLRSLQPGETYTIETPRGTVTMAGEGRYEIFAGDTDTPTTVSVLDGAAQISGNNISLQVHARQTASITGTTTYEGSVGPLNQDAFLTAMLQRETPVQPRGAAPPPVVAQMTGGEDLNQYGSWDSSADYGNVWYPDVGNDWVPYRDGRWSYVAPWGWTWVDAAPWGFAPFHYGRWVQIGPRWGWAPVYPGYATGYRPVYAPALVSFFGAGVAIGVGIGVGIGLGGGYGLGRGPAYGLGGNIGWVPLGPREAYYPPYRVSRVYVNRVNITNIRNVTNITNEAGARGQVPIGRYENNRAATMVPARAMADSRPVGGAFRQPTAGELAGSHALIDRAPIAPGGRTLGLTPRVAQQLKVADVEQRRAPGPQVAAAQGPEGGRASPLALRPARQGQGAGEVGRAGAPGPAAGPAMGRDNRPGGLPPLRAPAGAGRAEGAGGQPAPAVGAGAGAPGPRIERGDAGRPQLRQPGAEPGGRPAQDRTPQQADRAQVPRPAAGRTGGAQAPAQPAPAQRSQPAPAQRPQPAERPQVQRPTPGAAVRPQAERPQVARPQAERPQVARPQSERPQAARAQTERPQAARPQVQRPQAQARPQQMARPQPAAHAPERAPARPERRDDKPGH